MLGKTPVWMDVTRRGSHPEQEACIKELDPTDLSHEIWENFPKSGFEVKV